MNWATGFPTCGGSLSFTKTGDDAMFPVSALATDKQMLSLAQTLSQETSREARCWELFRESLWRRQTWEGTISGRRALSA
jgi:hypothetical protein